MSNAAEGKSSQVLCKFPTGRFTVTLRSSTNDDFALVAAHEKFAHAESFSSGSTAGIEVLGALRAFLQRASIAYHDGLAGRLKPGWYWVRYSGLFETRDCPAEWTGFHWGSASFAGLPYSAVSVLDSLTEPMLFGPEDQIPGEDLSLQMSIGHRLIIACLKQELAKN